MLVKNKQEKHFLFDCFNVIIFLLIAFIILSLLCHFY